MGTFAPTLLPGMQKGRSELWSSGMVTLNPKTTVLIRRGEEAETWGRGHGKTGTEIGRTWPPAKDTWSPLELEEAGTTLPQSPWRVPSPATPSFQSLASTAGRE